ncbi:amino acid permease [Paenibacillus sp. MY03]|uniref:amino acid permease n=1 Tax=Paenibacillus sp. MY03 TaxID=302980 RepID=UPI0015C612A9|nr:amino acid permease [Paenibacillus sp. MY03]
MVVAILGVLLAAIPCLFSVLVARKALRGLRAGTYQSLIPYGKDMQAAQDKSELQRFGLPQVLPRKGGGLSAAAKSFNAMGMVGGAALLFGPALASGGPSVIGFGLPLVALLSLCVSSAIAELASGVPTAGGVYHAAYQLGGRKWGMRAGWLQLAGNMVKLALFIGGFAYLADGLLASRLGYESSSISLFIVAATAVLTQGLIGQYTSGFSEKIEAGGTWLQLIIMLLALAGLTWLFWPGDYSPVVLYQGLDIGLTDPVGLLPFVIGLLLLSALFTGMDGAGHGAEEIVEPRIRVPWGIFLSSSYTYIGLLIVLLLMSLITLPGSGVLGEAYGVLQTTGLTSFTEYAAAAWGGSYLLPALILLSLWQSGLQTMTSCSRVAFSLARDGAIPFSSRLSMYSYRRNAPLYAIWFAATAAILLLVSTVVWQANESFMALVSASIVLLHLAAVIPIGLRWQADRKAGAAKRRMTKEAFKSRHGAGDPPPPWHLGNWGQVIRLVAMVWLVFSAILTAGIVHSFGGIVAAVVMLAGTAAGASLIAVKQPSSH